MSLVLKFTDSADEFPAIRDFISDNAHLVVPLEVINIRTTKNWLKPYIINKILSLRLYGVPYYRAAWWWLSTLKARIKGYRL